ncbi:hypothetical protein B0H11DRAFT_565490 [Mycena galericulata]|nr:hypothetical protein B0H11DRAFT_565490 [Mycena galericulata]
MYCSSLCTQETVADLPIGLNMFAPVRQNQESAEPRTEHGVRFGFGSGSTSVQNRTPATLRALYYINTSPIPSMNHPHDCGVLLAAPRSGDVRRRRDLVGMCVCLAMMMFRLVFDRRYFLPARVEIPPVVAKLSPRIPRRLLFCCEQIIFVTPSFSLCSNLLARANSFTTADNSHPAEHFHH